MLNNLAKLVRGSLPTLVRIMLCSLITIDVHARDIITNMIGAEVITSASFEWQRQLRYYWEEAVDNCVVRMSTSHYIYGYEYLGASPRLVITPLTDRWVSIHCKNLFLYAYLFYCVVSIQVLSLPNGSSSVGPWWSPSGSCGNRKNRVDKGFSQKSCQTMRCV